FYRRDAETNLAPDELKTGHPLGKSPGITDDGRTIAEAGAIVDYLVRRHGAGRLAPEPDDPAHQTHQERLDHPPGSGDPPPMLPLMLQLYTLRLGDAGAPLQPRIDSEIDTHLGYVDQALKGRDFLLGDQLTAADVQMSFVGEVGRAFGRLADKPNLDAWLGRL